MTEIDNLQIEMSGDEDFHIIFLEGLILGLTPRWAKLY